MPALGLIVSPEPGSSSSFRQLARPIYPGFSAGVGSARLSGGIRLLDVYTDILGMDFYLKPSVNKSHYSSNIHLKC